jgi:hypothetical protein
MKATDPMTIGQLFGFLKSACRVYGDKALLMAACEQDAVIAASSLPPYGFFRFSQQSWRQELEIVREWHKVLAAYGFAQSPIVDLDPRVAA